jgi:plastocyanin
LTRGHYDLAFYLFSLRNVANYSPPVLPLEDGVIEEWQILAKLALIAQGLGPHADPTIVDDVMIRSMIEGAVADEHGPLFGRDPEELLAALAPRTGPARIVDFMLRSGPFGDAFVANPAGSGQCPDGHGTSLDALLAAPHSITIAESAEPNAPLIACGDIGGLRSGDNVVIGLLSMSGSGQTGSAWLRGLNDVATTVTIFSAPGLFDPAAPLSTATLPPQPTTAAAASPAVTPTTATGTDGTEQVVNVQMEDFKFVPNAITMPANTPVKFVFRNTGLALHNFSIDALKTSTDVASGATGETTITAPAGTYQFYCDQPGHKELGMFGTLTVT